MPTSKHRRVIAILRLPRKVAAVLAFAEAVVKAIKRSRHFPKPAPQLAEMCKHIDELRAAQAASLGRTEGAVALRDEKLGALVVILWHLRAHVQEAADLDRRNAGRIIRSAGLRVRKEPVRQPLQFRARLGAYAGTVVLLAPAAARRASYDWAYSLDYGGTWKTEPATLRARTVVSQLPTPAIVKFRYRAITRNGEGPWSEPISVFVP